MWRYLARTVAQRLLLLVVISIISHAVIHLAPGEPSQVDPMNPMMKAADIARIRQSFHLDDPIYLQYLHWMRDLLTGELKSFRDGLPVFASDLGPLPQLLAALLVHDADRVDGVVPDWHSSRPAPRLGLRSHDHVHRLHADLDPRIFFCRIC